MEITQKTIESEIREWSKFRGHNKADASVVPVKIRDVAIGSVCRAWMAPNQSHFVFIGNTKSKEGEDVSITIRDDGNAFHLLADAWVVVLDTPASFPDLLGEMAAFNQRMETLAWAGRDH